MHSVLMVIRREYLDRVRKKSFWVGILLFPLIMALLMGAPMLMMAMAAPEEKRIAVVDATGRLLPWIERGVADEKLGNGRPEYRLDAVPLPAAGELAALRKQQEARVAADELFGVLWIGADPDAKGAIQFFTRKVGNIEAAEELRTSIGDAVTALRFERGSVGIPPERLREMTRRVDVETFQVSEEGRTTRKGFLETWLGTMMFVMVLYMSLLLYGIAVMRGVLEEKTTRVVEVLLGSLTPDQLMIGKILGVGLVGLTQIGSYVVLAVIARLLMSGGSSMASGIVSDAFTPEKMAYFVIFFVIGYFMYTALFAIVGAVCNTEQEAQNLQSPVVFCLAIPLLAALYFVNNPDSTPAVVASLIPIFTPMVMYMRISVLTPPFWQIALSIVLLLATTWLFFRAAAKVFRIGILMYGKRPTIPEILRWARRPEQVPVSAGAGLPGYERGARP